MPTGPSDLMFPSYTEGGVEKWAGTDMRRGPDFTDITKAFSSLMSNPSLIARGGNFVDPMQVQQDATPGYLGARAGVAENRMNNIANDAELDINAGSARGSLLSLINQLKSQQIGVQGSLFGTLLGGLQ
jgi:hypothetical protein